MATLVFNVSGARKELIMASCKVRGETLEGRFEGYFKDVESSVGFDHTETDAAEIAAAIVRAKNKGTRAENLRDEEARRVAATTKP